jgi:hypothetical protein
MNDALVTAILQTLHYADIFDYPLTRDELARYLIGVSAPPAHIDAALAHANILRVDNFLTLPQRQAIVAERLRLHQQAQKQIPRARWYARLIAYLPFVRMVALTGSLAMENARDDDIDFLIVCAPNRLWTVRALVIALVHLARWRGDHLCPNFLLSENALTIAQQNLYSAHEIIQMIPLFGFEVYRRIRQQNAWTENFLPNADGINSLRGEKPLDPIGAHIKRWAERWLHNRVGDAIETWEMRRKIKKLSAQIPPTADTVEFSRDVCRGFFGGYGHRVLAEFERRTANLRVE